MANPAVDPSIDGSGNIGIIGHLNQTTAGTFATVVTLASGAATFTYPHAYTSTPVCTCSPTSAAQIIRISAISTTAVTVTSALGTDTQQVQLIVVGNPS